MFRDVNVTDLDALDDWVAFVQKQQEAYEAALKSVAQSLARAESEVAARTDHWTREVAKLTWALAACLRQEDADCSDIEQSLEEAQDELEQCAECAKALITAREEYEAAATHLQRAMAESLPPGIAYVQAVRSQAADILDTQVLLMRVVLWEADRLPGRARSSARYHSQKEELALVQSTGRGTRPWSDREVALMRNNCFPTGYHAHHINSLSRFPELAWNPDNIYFATPSEHLQKHAGDWHHATGGRMFNRRSMMVQWARSSSRG